MIYLAYAIIYTATMASTVYLVDTGHPWFAFAVLIVGGSVSMKSQRPKGPSADDPAP